MLFVSDVCNHLSQEVHTILGGLYWCSLLHACMLMNHISPGPKIDESDRSVHVIIQLRSTSRVHERCVQMFQSC